MSGTSGTTPLEEARAHEPIFNAPWPAVAVAVVIVAGYALQLLAPDPDALVSDFALRPAQVRGGRLDELVTHIFLHGNWPHALLNAAGALVFATPVARLLGTSPARSIGFFLFYIACGALAGLGYAAAVSAAASVGGLPGLHVSPLTPMVGASGAISGLAGAAARLLEGGGRPGPIFSRLAVGMAAAWVVANVIIGVVGFAPGAGGAIVAWQVHIIGFFVGLVLIGPWAALFGRRWTDADSAPVGPFGAR
jgi:membrane associated rhomboid family serine protease